MKTEVVVEKVPPFDTYTYTMHVAWLRSAVSLVCVGHYGDEGTIPTNPDGTQQFHLRGIERAANIIISLHYIRIISRRTRTRTYVEDVFRRASNKSSSFPTRPNSLPPVYFVGNKKYSLFLFVTFWLSR